MGMMTLLVDRKGATLTLSSNQSMICLDYPDGQSYRVGIQSLKQIVIHGEITLPAALLRQCSAAGVSILLLPGRGKGETLQLLPHSPRNFSLRLAQYRAWFDPAIRLPLARLFVAGKIQNQQHFLNQHGLAVDFAPAIERALSTVDIPTLMGIEGSTSRIYFGQWGSLWGSDWQFHGRNRRPPLDPLNALLSLSYTLAGHQLEQMAQAQGLEPRLGFLHCPAANRPALALDLLEPVRPWIDQWLWDQGQNLGLLQPRYFVLDGANGCRLEKTGRNLFYNAWFSEGEAWLRAPLRNSLAQLLNILRKHRRLPVEAAWPDVPE